MLIQTNFDKSANGVFPDVVKLLYNPDMLYNIQNILHPKYLAQ